METGFAQTDPRPDFGGTFRAAATRVAFEMRSVEGEFDAAYYASEYPDVAARTNRLLEHFCAIGWFEGRNPNPFFDTVSYLVRYGDVAQSGMNPFFHYLFHGVQERRSISPSAAPSVRSLLLLGYPVADWVDRLRPHVDAAFYAARLGAAPVAGFDPVAHFAFRGWREGLDPSPSLRSAHLAARYPQAAALLVNPLLVHNEDLAGRYTARPPTSPAPAARADSRGEPDAAAAPPPGTAEGDDGLETVRSEFDADFYLRTNPDVARAAADPLDHFFHTGWREGRNPTAGFDTVFYLATYEDVRESGVNPFWHFLATGRAEGRSPRGQQGLPEPTTSSDDAERIELLRTGFSAAHYLAHNADVAAAGVDPVEHYYFNGWREGRNPTKHFDTQYYLEANEDVRAAGINPFWHYLAAGKLEGRAPARPGGYRRRILEAAREPASRTEHYVAEKVRAMGGPALAKRLDAALAGRTGVAVSVSHDCYVKVIGGTQIFIADEQKRLADRGYAYLHLSPLRPRLTLAPPDPDFAVRVVLNGKLAGVARLRTLVSLLRERAQDAARPAALFIVHCALGFDPDDLCALHAALEPAHSVYWLHDYSSLCEGFNLLRNDLDFCNAPSADSLACRVCVYGGERTGHLARMHRLFQHCGFHVASPSAFTLDLWRASTSLPHASAFAHPHWLLEPEGPEPAKRARGKNRRRAETRIAFVGFPSASKGWPIFSDLVDRFAADGRYAFYHFAAKGVPVLPETVFVETEVTPRDRSATARLLREHAIDYLAMLSPWPETFSFVAHEGVAAGCDLLSFRDSGNVAAMVRGLGRGFVFDGPAALGDFLASPAAVEHAGRARARRTAHKVVEAGTTATIERLFPGQARAVSGVKCFSSFTFSYLSRAILWAQTLRKAHPDWEIWAMMVDKPPPGADFAGALSHFDHVLYADELGIPRFENWLFKHDIVEACTAVKGKTLCYLLDQGPDKVVYFDPDIAVFHDLDSVVARLDNASVVLTPHQVQANTSQASVKDNELTSLKYGIFNLGFVAVRNDANGKDFAAWWRRQLDFACYDEVENGIFTDQKWCDLAPALFEGVFVERDPGCNVASWNLSTRRIGFDPHGRILVNGSPLKFYHYTKINSAGDLMTEKYAGDNVEIMEVWNWYKRALKKIHVSGIPSGYWHYGRFDNGEKIPKSARVFYRGRPDIMEYFEDPFATEGDSFHAWLHREQPGVLSELSRAGFEAI